MMRKNKALKVVTVLICVVAAAVVFGLLVMSLWNWLMPAIFGLHTITFVQAIGLMVLSKLLFGGIHKHGGGGGWKRGMRERFAQMTPEERERMRAGFRTGMGGGRGCGWGRAEEKPVPESVV